jgi:hypothetical protein
LFDEWPLGSRLPDARLADLRLLAAIKIDLGQDLARYATVYAEHRLEQVSHETNNTGPTKYRSPMGSGIAQ